MHRYDAGCFVHTFPFLHFAWWYACHAFLCHLLAFSASLHACLHVYAWVLLVSVSSMLQHNEAMDIWSKPTIVPRGHHLLFVFMLVCLFACWLAFLLSLHAMLAMSILLVCFAPFLPSSMHLSFSIACLLVSCLYLCMYTQGVRTHRTRTRTPRHKQKGHKSKHVVKPSGCSQ